MLTVQQRIRWFAKPLVFFFSLLPLAALATRAAVDGLGANPIEAITHATGDWALRMLLVTLAVTTLRHLLGWNWLMRLRRMLGLFAFFYASLHLLTYLVLDQYFAWRHIVEDIAERPYITTGFASFVMLVPLAVTSTNSMMRRLGGKRWQALHRLVYLVAIGGVAHYFWLVKADMLNPLIYLAVLVVLLAHRLRVRFTGPRSVLARDGVR